MFRRITMKVRLLGLFLMIGLLCGEIPLAHARTSLQDWSTVRALRPGDELVLITKADVTLKGKLVAVSDTLLTLRRNGRTNEIERADVKRVFQVRGRSVGKATLIGLGVGTAAGVATGAVVAATEEHSETGEELFPVTIFGAAGAAIGTVSGLATGLFRRKRRVLIYEAP
jgi:hypothetical protein